ncbi:MAG: type VI immunity family protein, partial [Kofleriaceae bacterium]
LTKAEKASLSKLYAAKRIVKESQAADDGEFDAALMRVDELFLGDNVVRGGVSRFIAAQGACVWLVGELAKLRGVVSVAFGDPPDTSKPIARTKAATASDEPPADVAKLELVTDGKVRVASLCFSIALFADKPLRTAPAAVLAAWHAFLDLGARERLRLWGTETTAPAKRKPVTESALQQLDKWLAKGAPAREFLALTIDDATTYEHAPRWRFTVWSHTQARDEAHFVRMSLPIRFGLERADEMAALARALFATGAFRSGIAGPCWECGTFSSYENEGNGHLHAAKLAERYPAIDLATTVNDALAVRQDGIQNVGWLTMLDPKLAAEVDLKGVRRLAGVTVEDAGKGVVIRAGDAPTLDGKREREIFAKLAPLVERTLPRLKWLSVDENEALHTFSFKMRLGTLPALEVLRTYAGVGEALLEAVQAGRVAAAKTALGRCVEALAKLRSIETDHEALRELIDGERAGLYANLGYAGKAAGGALAVEIFETALAQPDAPAALYGRLVVRGDPYVLSGVIPAAVAAKDRGALARHAAAAAKRAKEEPASHHALARAYVFLGEHDRAIDHVELAQGTYGDAKELRTDAPLAPIAKDPRFIAAFKRAKPARAR